MLSVAEAGQRQRLGLCLGLKGGGWGAELWRRPLLMKFPVWGLRDIHYSQEEK